MKYLLYLPSLLAIIVISLIISVIIVVIYKYFTDQDLMKRLKTEIKELQAEMKQLKDKPSEMMAVQKKAMETNMKYMMHSFKPTIVTFLPIIIIFGWLNAHMAFAPIIIGQEFSTTLEFEEGFTGDVGIVLPDGLTLSDGSFTQTILENKVSWTMTGDVGDYTIYYSYNDKEYQKNIIITEDAYNKEYAAPVSRFKDGILNSITTSNKKMTPFGNFSIFGWHPGWLATYILFSLIFSMGLRKIMKVY